MWIDTDLAPMLPLLLHIDSPILCEKECPQPKISHTKNDKDRVLRDSTKCEEERLPHKIGESNEHLI
jgi:hypothetical protein